MTFNSHSHSCGNKQWVEEGWVDIGRFKQTACFGRGQEMILGA